MVWSKRNLGWMFALVAAALIVSPGYAGDDDEDSDDTSASLTTLGVVSTAYFYQAHLTIGLLADAREKGLYSREKCSQLQQVNIQLLDLTQKQFNDLAKKEELSANDAKAIKEFGRLSELLRKEAQAIDTYWKSESDQDFKKYTAAHDQASKSMGRFLEK